MCICSKRPYTVWAEYFVHQTLVYSTVFVALLQGFGPNVLGVSVGMYIVAYIDVGQFLWDVSTCIKYEFGFVRSQIAYRQM